MSFYVPLGLIGLIGVPILILIYILKRRFEEQIVPSTFLWKRSLAYMKKKLPWNLRNSLLLLLQLLAIVLISLLLARPYVTASKSGETIVILDASASMLSTDSSGETRFDRAREKISALAEKADGNHRVTVICAGSVAEKVIHRSATRLDILAALDKCTCDWGTADTEGALALAQEVQKENINAEIVYYTDTEFGQLDGIRVEAVTNREWNVAALGLKAEQVGGAYRFTGQVASYGADARLTVALYVDGTFVSAKQAECRDGVVTDISFREYEANNYKRAEIRIDTSSAEDSLAVDNSLAQYNTAQKNLLVQVAFGPSHRDDFLYNALRSVKGVSASAVNVKSLTEDGYENRTDGMGNLSNSVIKYTGYDLYIFDGVMPEYLPEDGAIWLVNPPAVPEGIGAGLGTVTTAAAGSTFELVPEHPTDESYAAILEGLSFLDVAVKEYTPIEAASYQSLLYCEGDTVLAAGKEGHTRVVLMTIGLSNLPSKLTDYPLLIGNLVAYSCPTVFQAGNRLVGDVAYITVPPGAEQITVSRDNAPVNVMEAEDTALLFDTPGDYTVGITVSRTLDREEGTVIKKELTYSCYVGISDTESNLYYEQDALASTPPEDGVESFEPVEIWQYLLIALLVVLMAEWWVYYRA